VSDGVQQGIGRGNTVGPVDDRAVLTDDEHRAIDRFAVDAWLSGNRLQCAVFTRERQPVIDQQIERQLQMDLEALVAVEVVAADAEWNGIEISIGVDCPANRGQLVCSAGGEVFRIENQKDPVGAEVVGKGDRGSAGTLERKVDRRIPDLWSRQRLIGHSGILCEQSVQSPVTFEELGVLWIWELVT